MRKFKKSLMACLIAVFALTLGAGLGFMPKANTAKAEVSAEYTVVETSMMGSIQNCNAAGGNLNLFIAMPGLDNEVDGDNISFEGVDLASVFNSFGFFDNVMIGGKTLRELGCTSFWDNTLGYNVGEPKPRIYLHAHFDPETLAAAIADGTVNYDHMTMSTITIKEGTMVPGYRYLMGLDNAVVFKAGCEYETSVDTFAFERKVVGKTEVQSLKYVQDNGNGTGYFGVSLYGDDFAVIGDQEDGVGNNLATGITTWYNNDIVLLNGETGKVGNYSLVNLGSKGQGYFAFTAGVSEADLTSVTIPAGTKFPMYFYTGAKGSSHYNNGNKVISYYEVQTTKTFVKDENGAWYCADDVEEIETEITMASAFYGDGVGSDYFINIELSENDYAGLNTYGGTALTATEYFANSNMPSHILVNGEAFPVTGESYLNVWSSQNTFSTRGRVGEAGFTNATQIETITILAGCKFPSYELLENGTPKYYVATEDVTFVKVSELNWEKQVAFNLEAYKAEKIAEITAYKQGMIDDSKESNRLTLVEWAVEDITAATSKEEVDTIFDETVVEIDKLPLKPVAPDLSEIKATAKEELASYLADGEYTALQILDRDLAVANGNALIESATTEEGVAEALADAKALVDASLTRVANYVDVTAIVKVMDCYKANGAIFLQIIIPELEAAVVGEQTYGVKVGDVLDAFGLWDNILVGDKTLREWGMTGGWDNDDVIGYNVSEPKNNIYIHAKSTNGLWAESDVAFTNGIVNNYDVTIREGALIPSYDYFAGAETYDVYRTSIEVVSNYGEIAYNFHGHADVDVVDVQLAQDNGDSVYLAVGLSDNDFPVDGGHVEVADLYYSSLYNGYWEQVRINGANGIGKYALFNLNEGGNGRIALTVNMPYDQVESITIPAGTAFPTYALQKLPALNNGNVLVVVLRTTRDVTFYKMPDGSWASVDSYRANALVTIDNAKADMLEGDYFASDYATLTELYNEGRVAIENATDIAGVDSALADALASMQGISTKFGVIEQAKEEITNHKAGLFREAEESTRQELLSEAYIVLDEMESREEVDELVTAVKEYVDTLKTAAEYADEELAEVKASAREEISNYLDVDGYYADEQAEIAEAIAVGHQGVADATNEEEIAQAVTDAKLALDEILTKEEVVAQIKADLNAYKAEDGYFRAEEKAQRDAIVESALANLEGLTDKAEIDAIVADAKADVDELTTADEYLEAELAEVKASAKEEIEEYLADGDFLDSQVADRLVVVENALEALANAKSEEAIATIVADAKAEIDAIASSITIVDVPMLVYISDIHAAGGNMNMFVIIPSLDVHGNAPIDGVSFANYDKAALEALFGEFGLYDMVYINDRSLRDWGFVGFWNESVGFNVAAPNPAIYLHMHTDNPEYAEAVANGDITFTAYAGGVFTVAQSPVSVDKGLIIPGYAYLSGADNSVVYRAIADFVTEGAARPYDVEANAYVDVDSVAYVQEDRNDETGDFLGIGYFGVSLEGDDYPAFEGDHIEVAEYIRNYVTYDGILINGEAGLVNRYALYNLGENGKGRISFQITVSEEEMYSITIPAGTIFPSYASNLFPEANGGNGVFVFYRTNSDVTFVKTANGWVKFEEYVQSSKDALDDLAASKEGLDCFEADLELIATTLADAKAEIDEATTVAEIEEIVANASAIIDAIQAKDSVIADAKAEIESYKAGMFREEEEALRLEVVAEALICVEEATSSVEVEEYVTAVKDYVDTLKTANEYAKEEIAEDVVSAKTELDGYKADADLFRDEEAEERLDIIEEAKLALDEALSIDEVNAIVADAKDAIDALKTDAEYEAEEMLAMIKQDAIASINAIKASIDLSLYDDDAILTISTLYNEAKIAIENATNEEEIASIVADFEADIEAVPEKGDEPESDSESITESKDEESKETSGGCLGSISGLSSVFALLTIMAGAVVLKKKRD